jgi:diguanylate cyclase
MPFDYTQSREESAALLKRVITEMGRHDAPFVPTVYAVWFEYLAGINPALTTAMQALLAAHARLDAAHMQELHRLYVAVPDDEDAARSQAGFLRVLETVANHAHETGREAGDFGNRLAGFSQVLHAEAAQPSLTPGLGQQVMEIEAGTSRMQGVVAALAQVVNESRNEVQQLRQALERSRVEAVTDTLSQLLNRKGFDNAMHEVLRQAPSAGHQHCLAVFDIDHFKTVNDTHGHAVGDTVIQTVAQLIRKLAKGDAFYAARIGGEEFAVLCRNSTLHQATQLAQGVNALVRGTTIRNRSTQTAIATVTISAGVSAYMHGDNAESFLASADKALYRAKSMGRDRVCVA